MGAFVALVTAGSVAAAFIFQKQRKLRMLSHLLRAVPSLLLVWDPAGCRERKVLALSPSQQLLPVLALPLMCLYTGQVEADLLSLGKKLKHLGCFEETVFQAKPNFFCFAKVINIGRNRILGFVKTYLYKLSRA